MSDVNINIKLVTGAAQAQLEQLKKRMEGVDRATKDVTGSTKKYGSQLGSIGTIAKGVFLGNLIQNALYRIVGAANAAVLSFVEFEAGLVSIGKTTGISGKSLAELGKRFQELSLRIPVAGEQLLRIGTIAGQLGINASNDILKFTETIARLGVSVEGASIEEFAQQLSRIAILTKTPIQNVDKLASSLVGLGNNLAANEAQIASTALEVAKSTAQYKLSAEDVLGLSGALSALGNSAEISGSATQRILRSITQAAAEGGAELDKFTKITGLTNEQFRNLVKNSPADAVLKLVTSLGKLSATEVTKALNEIGLSELRVARVTNSLEAGNNELSKSLRIARDEFQKNTAVYEESDRVFKTTKSLIQDLKNTFTVAAEQMSELFNPAIRAGVEFLTKLGERVIKVTEELKEMFNVAGRPINYKGGQDLDAALAFRNELLTEAKKRFEENERAIKDYELALKNAIAPDNIKRAQEMLDKYKSERESLKNIVDLQQQRVNGIIALQQAQGKTPAGTVPDGEPTIDEVTKYYATRADIRAAFDEQSKLQEQLRIEEEQLLRDFKYDGDIAALERYYLRVETLRQEDKIAAAKTEAEKQKIITDIAQKAAKQTSKQVEQENLRKEQSQAGTLDAIAGLTRSSNRELFEIGKAASIAKATIAGKEAVTNAYRDVPYPFNFAAAALVAAATAENIRAIASQSPPKFASGGIVDGNSFSGDRVEARVNSGEMILNRAQQSQLFQIANGQGSSGQSQPQEIVLNNVIEIDGEAVFKSVSRQVADGKILGENQ